MNFLRVQSLRIWDYPILIPVTGKQKARSLILAKRRRTRTWGSKWDSRSHPAFVGLEWEFLPFPPGTSKPTQLICPQPHSGPARSATSTRYHSQDPLGQTSVPACHTHCVNTGPSGLVSPFQSPLCVGLANRSSFLGSTFGTFRGFSYFLALFFTSISSFSPHRGHLNLALTPKDPSANSLMRPTEPVCKGLVSQLPLGAVGRGA